MRSWAAPYRGLDQGPSPPITGTDGESPAVTFRCVFVCGRRGVHASEPVPIPQGPRLDPRRRRSARKSAARATSIGRPGRASAAIVGRRSRARELEGRPTSGAHLSRRVHGAAQKRSAPSQALGRRPRGGVLSRSSRAARAGSRRASRPRNYPWPTSSYRSSPGGSPALENSGSFPACGSPHPGPAVPRDTNRSTSSGRQGSGPACRALPGSVCARGSGHWRNRGVSDRSRSRRSYGTRASRPSAGTTRSASSRCAARWRRSHTGGSTHERKTPHPPRPARRRRAGDRPRLRAPPITPPASP